MSGQAKNLPVIISTIAAFFKAMGFSYKRLTPFLAIIMQGALFNLGTLLFGCNIVGQSIGAILSSFWGFAQPLLIAYFVFGSHMLDGFQIAQHFCATYLPFLNLFIILFACVAFKGCLSVLMVILARRIGEKRSKSLENLFLRFSEQTLKKPEKKLSFYSPIKEFFSLWFLLPLGISMISVIITEPHLIKVIITFLRMIGCYILLFMIFNAINVKKLIWLMRKRGWINLSKHLDYCLVFLSPSKRL
ncbi:MAG: hypothetical protein K2Q34_08175 [Alphaproteobacteria bacterium]|nr:hypothetical protein [Alphaproteobacteria bacterium]